MNLCAAASVCQTVPFASIMFPLFTKYIAQRQIYGAKLKDSIAWKYNLPCYIRKDTFSL
jgi:hypothetical protein